MTESSTGETKPKKMVSRNVAVALGIICVLLFVGIGGASVYYVSTHSHSNSDYDAMLAPELIVVGLTVRDNSPFVNITGYVVNVHNNSAFNSGLHMVYFFNSTHLGQSEVSENEFFFSLGTIPGESWEEVNQNPPYYGTEIINYTITPQWTNYP